jgi:RNA polymerase sigma-70 factor (ECF subfamily)
MTERDSVAGWELAASGAAESVLTPSAGEQEVIQLFDELRSRLMRYLFSLGLPMHESEEVVQETFLALFQHLQQGKPRQNLRGWIFRVAHNLGLKQRQARTREVAGGGDLLAAAQADPGENPEEQLLTSQRRKRLQAVLRALPDQDRWCLALRAEGLRYREIAETLDMPLASVSASLGRSLGRLSRADGR